MREALLPSLSVALRFAAYAILAAAVTGCVGPPVGAEDENAKMDEAMSNENYQKATFAGGCFWCMEPPFDSVDGVISTTSGYIGGHKDDPTYEEVSAGGTGHTEAIEIVFDPAKVGYAELLEVFWRNIDPTTANRQFCDVGSQYRTGVFYHDEEQKKLAEQSRARIDDSGALPSAIVTEIVEAGPFYPAEDYHQDYYKKNPIRYKFYRNGCGRDDRLEQLWGEES
jgi:peptide-methionine (S)-S-oxide reductase